MFNSLGVCQDNKFKELNLTNVYTRNYTGINMNVEGKALKEILDATGAYTVEKDGTPLIAFDDANTLQPCAMKTYIDSHGGGASQNLSQVLANGNSTGGLPIDGNGSDIRAGKIQTDNITLLPGTLETQIRVADNIELATAKRFTFEDNAIIQATGGLKKVIETTDALLPTITYKFGNGNVVYTEETKVLEVNPVGFPPSPMLATQGVKVNGSLETFNGDLKATNGGIKATGDIHTQGIVVSKESSQPRMEFQDVNGIAQGQIGWNSAVDKTILQSKCVLINTDNTNKYKIEMGDNQGYLGIETIDVGTQIRHYDAGLSMDANITSGMVELPSARLTVQQPNVQT